MSVPRRPLGTTGIDVPCLALGTVKIGRNTGVKYPCGFELPGDDEVIELLHQALDAGINLVDTAPAYGTSESRLGELLPGSREDWMICTKAGETFANDRSRYDFSSAAIEASVEMSLNNLKTEYLDLVLIHSDDNDLEIVNESGAFEALQGLKSKGLVRWIGMSVKSVDGGLAALPHSDVLMITLNLADRSQLPLIAAAGKAGCGVLIKKSMDSGHGDPLDSLDYVLSEKGISSVVSGTINPEHLQQNIEVAVKAP